MDTAGELEHSRRYHVAPAELGQVVGDRAAADSAADDHAAGRRREVQAAVLEPAFHAGVGDTGLDPPQVLVVEVKLQEMAFWTTPRKSDMIRNSRSAAKRRGCTPAASSQAQALVLVLVEPVSLGRLPEVEVAITQSSSIEIPHARRRG